jgi:undecaprenyl-diphosphatase
MIANPERQERAPVSMVALLTVAALIVAAVLVGYSVSRGTSQTFDEQVLLTLRVPGQPTTPIGPVWLTEVARDITALGGVAVLTLLTCLATIHLLLRREWGTAALVAAAAISGTMASNVLKDMFARPRPELTAIAEYGVGSFPSGHSTASAVVYLTLGLLLAHAAEQQRMKIFYVLTAILLTTLVGLSRLYLGVHYPTDVAAGWAIGSAWALICSLIATAIGGRKHSPRL